MLVVKDEIYDILNAEETSILVLGLKKAADKQVMDYEFEEMQLVNIKE